MALIEHDHMVEQVPAAVADPTLDNAVLPRTSEAGPLGLDAEALHGIDHPRIETGTAIKDQLAGYRVVRERLTQLLNHPGAGGVPGEFCTMSAEKLVLNSPSNSRKFRADVVDSVAAKALQNHKDQQELGRSL